MHRTETIAEGVTLYLGDCLDIVPRIDPVDAVVTDPPFCVGFKYASHDDRPEAYEAFGGYGAWLMERLAMAEAVCRPGSPLFVWQAAPNLRRFHEWFPRDYRLFVAAKNFVQMRPTPMQWSFDPIVVWWTPGEKGWSAGTATRDFHIANTAPIVATPDNIEKGAQAIDIACVRPESTESPRAKLEALLRVAAEQWPNKSPEDQAIERKFIERDYRALTGCRVSVKP